MGQDKNEVSEKAVKVSILVAVYNAENSIGKCLDSLTAQTLKDIQVICIDDGSTDKSPSILDEYAKRDKRINVIHLKENQGLAHARNIGLNIAIGEYTCMLDSDDWFAPDALEKAVEVFEKHPFTDCVLFKFILVFPDREETFKMPDFEVLNGQEAFSLSLGWRIHGVYMVRTEIHKKHPYDETCHLYSDENTTHIHYSMSREVRVCDGIYYYLQHEKSATHSISVRKFDKMKADYSLRTQMTRLGMPKRTIDMYENQRWLNIVNTYMFYHCHGKELVRKERIYGLEEMKRAWKSIDRKALDTKTTRKFGYMPMPVWSLFRLQEWAYFTLRGLLGRNK